MSTGHEPSAPDQDNESKGLLADNPWWGFFLIGLFFVVVSIWLFFDLVNLETEGGTRQVHWAMSLIYQWFGKWGVALPPFLFGLGFLGGGVFRLLQKR